MDVTRPKLLFHGHYHQHHRTGLIRRWGQPEIIGLASNAESGDRYEKCSMVLDLPGMTVR